MFFTPVAAVMGSGEGVTATGSPGCLKVRSWIGDVLYFTDGESEACSSYIFCFGLDWQ